MFAGPADPLVVDSHCHLDMLASWRKSVPPTAAEEAREQAEIVARARAAGVGQIVVSGCAWQDFGRVREAAERFADVVWVALGIHPHEASTWEPASLERLATAADDARVVAIGECGLDYHYDLSPRVRQQEAFRDQVRLARALKKPLVVHTREAEEDTAAILAGEGAAQVGGVMHCFTGTWDLARLALDMGFFISFSGVITFASSNDLRTLVARVPLERTLVETDAPYLAPVPYRGKRNEPAWVVRTVEALAAIHGLEPAEVGQITAANARRLFGLPVSFSV